MPGKTSIELSDLSPGVQQPSPEQPSSAELIPGVPWADVVKYAPRALLWLVLMGLVGYILYGVIGTMGLLGHGNDSVFHSLGQAIGAFSAAVVWFTQNASWALPLLFVARMISMMPNSVRERLADMFPRTKTLDDKIVSADEVFEESKEAMDAAGGDEQATENTTKVETVKGVNKVFEQKDEESKQIQEPPEAKASKDADPPEDEVVEDMTGIET